MKPENLRRRGLFCLALALAVCLAGLWVSRRKDRPPPAARLDYVMDTVVEYRLYGKNADAALAAASARLRELDQALSPYLDGSQIQRINENAGIIPIPVSPDVMGLLERTKSFSLQAGDVFDITIGALSQEWKKASEREELPDPRIIQELAALTGAACLELDPAQGTAYLSKFGQKLDLGAAAKGYACDEVRRICGEYGITDGYISVGGNLVVLDSPDLVFGVRDPRGAQTEYMGTLSIPGLTMATTGDYERYFEKDGVRYHHVLDPGTGYPARTDLISVSVISKDGLLTDFMSTALFVAGKERASQYLNEESFYMILVDKDGGVLISDQLKGRFTLNAEKPYHWAEAS